MGILDLNSISFACCFRSVALGMFFYVNYHEGSIDIERSLSLQGLPGSAAAAAGARVGFWDAPRMAVGDRRRSLDFGLRRKRRSPPGIVASARTQNHLHRQPEKDRS